MYGTYDWKYTSVHAAHDGKETPPEIMYIVSELLFRVFGTFVAIV